MSDNHSEDLTDPTQLTVSKTLWSETVIEMLIVALDKQQSDEKVIELLKEVKQKKFKNDYIIGKVDKSLGSTEANRARLLLRQL